MLIKNKIKWLWKLYKIDPWSDKVKSPLKLDVCRLTHPFVDGYENEDRDNDDNLFDGRRHEDVVGNKLGGEVDAVGAAADSDPDNDLGSML